MKNSYESQNLEGPNPEIHTSLSGKGSHGSMREKRGSIAAIGEKLKVIMALLPHESQRKIANQVEFIRKDPEKAIEVIRNEVEAQREILDLLDNPISTDEALEMLDEIVPKETIQ
jgi:hypothetical protein